MILASDGVWEFIESQDAVDIVGNCETVEEGCRQVYDCGLPAVILHGPGAAYAHYPSCFAAECKWA